MTRVLKYKTPFVARWKKAAVIGNQFGAWTVVLVEEKGFTCQCSCGRKKLFNSDTASNLLLGKSPRCTSRRAYLAHKRGISGVYASIIPGIKLRQSWLDRYSAMVSRCTNRQSLYYVDYGGRGIKIGKSFSTAEKYLRHIITLPNWDQPWAQLDRIDNDAGYTVGNVRIVDSKTNLRNTRRTVFVKHNGERLCALDFWQKYCPLYRMPGTVSRKIKAGYSPERIIAEQSQCYGPRSAA